MTNMQSLRSHLQAHGLFADIELALDGGEQLTVKIVTAKESKRAFSAAIRPEGVFILGFRGCFRLDDSADVVETLLRLAAKAAQSSEIGDDSGILSLQPYPYRKWLADGRLRVSTEREAEGWMQLPDNENRQLWTDFTKHFSFRMGLSPTEWPAIVEPSPFMTWSVSSLQRIYESDPEQFFQTERLSRGQLIRAFGAITPAVDRFYALDLNHDGYSFDPTVVAQSGMTAWPVRIIPIHNYSVFIDPTFSVGLFGHPWEASICVFGARLLTHIGGIPLPWAGEVIRSSSPPPL